MDQTPNLELRSGLPPLVRFWICIVFATHALTSQPPIFRTESKLVEVPVVVLDRKTGKPIEGLTAQDFVLLEAGKPQQIEFFSAYQPSASQPSASQPLRTTIGAIAPANTQDPPIPIYSNRKDFTEDSTPVMVVLIDGMNARFEDQYYAAKAARDFIEKSEAEARWAIFYLGRAGLRIVHDYSTDRSSLIKTLKNMRGGGDAPNVWGTGSDISIPSAQSEITQTAASQTLRAEEYLRILTTLNAIGDVGRHLHALPGRKTLVWMTAGFSLNKTIQNLPLLWYRTLDILNDANTAVYSVDSNGVRTTGGYLAEIPTGRTLQMRRGLASQQEPTQVMSVLASSTGGLAFLNSNNLEKGIAQALYDSRVHYRLAYRTAQTKLDGRQVALKVEVPGRRGLEIRYRRSFTASPLVVPDKPERERLLADAIVSPLEAVEIGLKAQILEIPGSQQSLLRLTMDPDSVTLTEEHGRSERRFQGRFDIRCVQASADAKVLDDFTDEATLNLDAEKAQRTLAEGFHYEIKVNLQAEAKFLKLAFCDLRSGRLGSLKIELPSRQRPTPP